MPQSQTRPRALSAEQVGLAKDLSKHCCDKITNALVDTILLTDNAHVAISVLANAAHEVAHMASAAIEGAFARQVAMSHEIDWKKVGSRFIVHVMEQRDDERQFTVDLQTLVESCRTPTVMP